MQRFCLVQRLSLVIFGASSSLMKSRTYGNRAISLRQDFLEFLLSQEKPLLLSH